MSAKADSWLHTNLKRQWKSYSQRLRQCQHRASGDAVHKLRTATRRLVSLIELLQRLTPQPSLKRLRKTLKSQLDTLDQLRDTQVMRQGIGNLVYDHPELTPFLHHLYVEEQRLLMATDENLNHFGHRKLRRPLKKAIDRSYRALSHDTIQHRLITVIDTLYHIALERYQCSNPQQPASLHALRISLKKLRYSLELTQSVLPAMPDQVLFKIQTYLNKLGDIQNAEVLENTLNAYYDADFPKPLRQFFLSNHQTLINDYLAIQDTLHEFWRADAQQPFPWDTQ
jgi:CHAD domain-containing protein